MSDALEAAVWGVLGLAAASWLLPGQGAVAAGSALLVAVAAAVASWAGATFRRVRTIELAADGRLRVEHGDGSVETVVSDGHRVIGRSVCLRWRSPAQRRFRIAASVWLTPRDVPATELRRLAVVLRCASRLEM